MLISVIIPTYNRTLRLERCIKSVLCQDYPREHYEIIIVDDGSYDKTSEFINKFMQISRVRYLYQKNKGPAAARNLGVKSSNGEVLIFIDDDCVANNHWLTNFIAAFQKNPDFQIIQGPYVYKKSSNPFAMATQIVSTHADTMRIIDSVSFSEKKEAIYIGTGNLAIFKKTILAYALFFDEALSRREDEDLYRRVQEYGLKVGFIDNPIIHECQFDFISDFKRYFYYGRGEYYLRKKWGGYTRLKYNIKFRTLQNQIGWWKGFFITVIIKIRSFIFLRGYLYERFLNYRQT